MRRIKYNNQERDKLQDGVSNSKTLREVLIYLGRSESSGSYKYLQRRLKFYSIDSSGLLNKSQILKGKHKLLRKDSSEIFVENSSVARSSVKKRIIEEQMLPYKCSFCENVGEWMGKKIALILDHINGESRDNRIDNLRLVCPNCNATLETHCLGKKGLDRKKVKIMSKQNKSAYYTDRPYIEKLSSRKVERPSKEKLKLLIKESNFSALGRMYGVSDNAVRKWARYYNLL